MKSLFTLIFIAFLIEGASAQEIKQLTANNSWNANSLSDHKVTSSVNGAKNKVTAPYTALEVNGKTISLLGRKIVVNADGLPAQIQTFFTPEVTKISAVSKDLFTEPVHFHVTGSNHKDIIWKNGEMTFTGKQPALVEWSAVNTSDSLNMEINASAEFNGFLTYTIKFIAKYDIKLDNIRLHLPFTEAAAKYVIGLGQKGNRPDTIAWKWDVANKNQDGIWIGDVNAGLQYSLRDNHYVSPSRNTGSYLKKPLVLPASWGNEGKGGIQIFKKGTAILADSYSGERLMKKGDVLYYNFTMLITPVHPISN